MNKQIPYVFDDVEFYQDLAPTSFSNTCRTRVRAFYKYGNRNGSYITDEVAEMLIQTAPTKPIVGFYNRETLDFEGHTVSELAKGYGFISENPNFAWEEHFDCDGKKRTYACFDVILHVDYWEEAGQIIGKSQSMELDIDSIEGDWVEMEENNVYFVYTKAKMKGFCVLGEAKEPCFEGSSFVGNETRFEKFSLLITDLIDKYEKGGKEMDLEQVVSTEEPVVTAFEESTVDASVEPAAEVEPAVDYEALYNELKADYENLQNEINSVKESFTQANTEHDAAKANYEQEIAGLKEQLGAKEAIIDEYQKADNAIKTQQKENLIKSYEQLLDAEDIASVKEQIDSFTYEEIESSLAVKFSKKSMAEIESGRVHCPEHTHSEEDEFALFMKNYKR